MENSLKNIFFNVGHVLSEGFSLTVTPNQHLINITKTGQYKIHLWKRQCMDNVAPAYRKSTWVDQTNNDNFVLATFLPFIDERWNLEQVLNQDLRQIIWLRFPCNDNCLAQFELMNGLINLHIIIGSRK